MSPSRFGTTANAPQTTRRKLALLSQVALGLRNALWPGYKTGEGMDPMLYGQFEPLEEALSALGLVVWPSGPAGRDARRAA